MEYCCWNNVDKAKYVARAKWVCPVCGQDVSLAYILYRQAIDDTESKWPRQQESNLHKTA